MVNVQIINTPGYFYSLAYFVSSLVVFMSSKRRYGVYKSALVCGLFFIAIVTFMNVTDGIAPIFFMPCILTSIGIVLIFIYKSCKMSLIQAGYYCARAFIIGELLASFAWQITYFAYAHNLVKYSFWCSLIFITVIYSIGFAFFYLIEKYYFGSKKIKIYSREILIVILITLSVFLISNLNYIYYSASSDNIFSGEFFTIRTLVDLSGVVVLYAFHIQKKELQSKNEIFLLQNILNIQYFNYKMMEESMDIVNQKYHDLKHQIFLLRKEAVTDESKAYLDKMEEDIKLYEVHIRTGHQILDTVLTGKSLYCKNKNITFTCVVDGKALSFMEDMDICALFGNLIDNAIEAVEKVDNIDERIIHLAVSVKKSFLSIRLSNQYLEDLYMKNGLPQTTKNNKNLHGFGLKSIQSTVNKYDGVFAMETKNNTFSIRILIPCEGKVK